MGLKLNVMWKNGVYIQVFCDLCVDQNLIAMYFVSAFIKESYGRVGKCEILDIIQERD